jgi:DNA-binding MltR family transcriptional regulator
MSHRGDLGSFASLNTDHLIEVLTKLDDRAAAIMATSMLESLLSAAISYKFRRFPTDTDYKLMFRGFGPLATFSAKIIVGYHIGVLSVDLRHDLQIMKDIRNDFAHDFSPLSFSTQHIADRCKSLRLKKAKVQPGSPLAAVMPTGPRGDFVACFFNVVGSLVMHFALLPHEKKLLEDHAKDLIEKAKESFTRRDFGQ